MRQLRCALLIVLGALPLGCFSYCPYLLHNMITVPIEVVHTCQMHHRLRRLADEAWLEHTAHGGGEVYSKAYAQGFRAGFVDYVESGGSGEAPPAPPFRLRQPPLRTPAEQDAIEEWFAGFRMGALRAKDSGLREGVIVPLSAEPRYHGGRASPPMTPHVPMTPSAPLPETLPPPRVVPPPEKKP